MAAVRKPLFDDPVVKTVPEVSVRLVREREFPYDGLRFNTPAQVAEFLQFDQDQDRERFYVLMLNSRKALVAYSVVAVGVLNAVPITARELFKAAILQNAYCVILAHNHPSGDPCPSDEDVQVTRRMGDAGKLLGIPVLDHVVFTQQGKYVSLRDSMPGYFPLQRLSPDGRVAE